MNGGQKNGGVGDLSEGKMQINKSLKEIEFKINELNKSELEKDEALNIFYNWITEPKMYLDGGEDYTAVARR